MIKDTPRRFFLKNLVTIVIVLAVTKVFFVWTDRDSWDINAFQVGVIAAVLAGMLTRLWVDTRRAKRG